MRTIVILFIAIFTVTSLGFATQQKPPLPLFHHLKPGNSFTMPSLGLEVIAAFPVRFDIPALGNLKVGDRVQLNLSRDVDWVGIIVRVDKRTPNSFSLFGELENLPHGQFIVTVYRDVVMTHIDAQFYRLLFGTRYAGDGVHLITQIDTHRLAGCGNDEVLLSMDSVDPSEPLISDPFSPSHTNFTPQGDDFGVASCGRPMPVIDMLMVYTSVARANAGGTNAIRAICQQAVDLQDLAYQNSNIALRARLAHMHEIEYDENGSYGDHLNRLTNGSDGFFDEVHTLRNDYRADHVALLVNHGTYCGLAWCAARNVNYAFSVTTYFCVNGNTHAHEVGHNQGCHHDRENAGGGCNLYSYSYGRRFYGTNGTQYRSVMAYSPGQRINYFTNPDVSFAGTPTGVPIGEANEAHNAATITDVAPDHEDFRVLDVWVDFSYNGTQTGTFGQPFKTTAAGANAIPTHLNPELIGYPKLRIKAGTQTGNFVINRRVRIESCGGMVTLIGSP